LAAPSLTAAAPLPRHIAIIMDGNGRWAKQRQLPRLEGHRAGAKALQRTAEACNKAGISYLTVYAFSTENWNRPAAEVQALMQLLQQFLSQNAAKLCQQNIRLRVIGQLQRLPATVQKTIAEVTSQTQACSGAHLTLAVSYGSRDEITAAMQAIAAKVQAGALEPTAIDAATISAHLYTADLPDPDLIIRSSGEMRLSNFLLWQASYAEIWVTPVLWPDFGAEHLQEALRHYQSRQRRFGGVDHV